jgi:hypothetical protein
MLRKLAHRGMQRHRFEQIAVVAEGVAREGVVVVPQREGLEHEGGVAVRHHLHLRQRERDALAQLVIVGERGVAGIGQLRGMDEVGLKPRLLVHALGLADPLQIRQLQRSRRGELFLQPRLDAELAQARNVLRAAAIGRLIEQACGLLVRRFHRRWGFETVCKDLAQAATGAGRRRPQRAAQQRQPGARPHSSRTHVPLP